VGAASSRDHFISRLKAAPTGIFYGNLDFPDKRILYYKLFIAVVINMFRLLDFLTGEDIIRNSLKLLST